MQATDNASVIPIHFRPLRLAGCMDLISLERSGSPPDYPTVTVPLTLGSSAASRPCRDGTAPPPAAPGSSLHSGCQQHHCHCHCHTMTATGAQKRPAAHRQERRFLLRWEASSVR